MDRKARDVDWLRIRRIDEELRLIGEHFDYDFGRIGGNRETFRSVGKDKFDVSCAQRVVNGEGNNLRKLQRRIVLEVDVHAVVWASHGSPIDFDGDHFIAFPWLLRPNRWHSDQWR